MAAEPGQTLSHYRLLEKLGEGGMAVVWKAEDTVLGRTVAIKILPVVSALDEERRRMFLDEARLASSVSHGNIVQVHELGRAGDLDYIVMEHIEGQTLAQLIHGRPLPPEKIAGWGVQIADGLARAHRKGLLHRDLKPANIMITPDGEAKIVDFGLATLLAPEASTLVSTELLTNENLGDRRIAGTLPYMSPEQVTGGKLDTRSDIFSCGTILYEMATGQRPFKGATTMELAREIQTCRPRPVHELTPKIPLDLDRIIEKALSRRPEDRYQGMSDMAVDLKRLGRELETGSSTSYEELRGLQPGGRWRRLRLGLSFAALLLASTAVGVWLWSRMHDRARLSESATALPALAVLPFTSVGQHAADAEAGVSFAEGLTTRFSELPGLEVISSALTRPYAGDFDIARLRDELQIDRILVGSIDRGPERTRISAQLIDATRGANLWAGEFVLATNRLPALQDSLKTVIANALGIATGSSTHFPISARWMDNSRAHAYFLAGTEKLLSERSWHRAADAREWFERALEVDPDYAPAICLLADVIAFEPSHDAVMRPGRLERAEELVQRALTIDPTLVLAKLMRARLFSAYDDEDAAIAAAQEVVREHPTLGLAYWRLGQFYAETGRRGDAIASFTRSIEFDDTNPRAYRRLGEQYDEIWEFGQAERIFRESVQKFPGSPRNARRLAVFLESQERDAEALQIRENGLAEDPDDPYWYIAVAGQLQSLNRSEEAEQLFDQLLEKWPNEARAVDWAGWFQLDRKEYDAARSLFEKAIRLEPYLSPAWRNLASCLERADEIEAAEKLYQQWVEQFPDSPEPMLSQAFFYEHRDRHDETERILLSRAERWPTRVDTNIDVARYFNRRNRHDIAEQWALKALAVAPNSPRPYNQLGWESWHQEKFNDARRAFEESIRRSPDWSDSHWGLTRALMSLSLPDTAEIVMENYLRKRPGDWRRWDSLGWVLINAGKNNRAAGAYEKELELNPRSASAVNNLAIIYDQVGRHQKAMEMFRLAAELDSLHPTPWFNLAAKSYTDGDDVQATKAAETAIRVGGESSDTAASMQLLLCKIARRQSRPDDAEKHLETALRVLEQLVEDRPMDPDVLLSAALAHGLAGETPLAREFASRCLTAGIESSVLLYDLACVMAESGSSGLAFDYLERAIELGFSNRELLEIDPDLDSLRDDPRFDQLVAKVR